MTSAYDLVLNSPDRETRRNALDRYRIEVLEEGLKIAVAIVKAEDTGNWKNIVWELRQAAKDLEDV
jgi:hypothetical protein